MEQWLSEKQKLGLLNEELNGLKKQSKKLKALLNEKRAQNTHNTRVGKFTLPDVHITVTLAEIEKILK